MLKNIYKIKIVFLTFVTFNFVIALYLYYSSQQTTISHTSYSTVESFQDETEFLSEEVYDSNQRTVGDAKSLEEFENDLNLRDVSNAKSLKEFENLLNIRKLILFAVHELNKPLKYTGCAKWWANPLDLDFHNTKFISTTHVDHLIKFRIQPGNLKMDVKIRQQIPPIRLEDRELEIISSFEIPNFEGKLCDGEPLLKNVTKICLCVESKRFKAYNKTTSELRKDWQKIDPELNTWPPDKSFLVEDYMNFTDYEWFVTSAGNTIQEVAELRYSTEYCGPDIKMLVMVSSAPSHFEHRKVIRETYASSTNLDGRGIKVVFLMGIPTDTKLNENVKREADITKDIIQANFEDSDHNLTISHLSMYKWVHLTCIEGKNSGVTVPRFLLKADDDFLINVNLALIVAEQNTEHAFIGCLYCDSRVVRDLGYFRKYYTPRYMHISNSYAGYLSGVAYVLRTDVIPLLLHASTTTPIIHMDDVYVSGLLSRQVNIQPIECELFTYLRIDPDACTSKQMVDSRVLDTDDMITQWNMFVQPMPSNCTLEYLNFKVREFNEGVIRDCFYNRFDTKN